MKRYLWLFAACLALAVLSALAYIAAVEALWPSDGLFYLSFAALAAAGIFFIVYLVKIIKEFGKVK
ncbi:MAG: hypothetical protein PHW33_02105 [Candidatus Portnoybacteria bacterium]|jgi:hypothetical protein|nr:hypothetical protein [Candidatus Portnoybacteria bacterium]